MKNIDNKYKPRQDFMKVGAVISALLQHPKDFADYGNLPRRHFTLKEIHDYCKIQFSMPSYLGIELPEEEILEILQMMWDYSMVAIEENTVAQGVKSWQLSLQRH
jgi:hypothetical protein